MSRLVLGSRSSSLLPFSHRCPDPLVPFQATLQKPCRRDGGGADLARKLGPSSTPPWIEARWQHLHVAMRCGDKQDRGLRRSPEGPRSGHNCRLRAHRPGSTHRRLGVRQAMWGRLVWDAQKTTSGMGQGRTDWREEETAVRKGEGEEGGACLG
ncbi:hypothetical protein VTI74DRAFT_8140 [Chaetomium olivicolor]